MNLPGRQNAPPQFASVTDPRDSGATSFGLTGELARRSGARITKNRYDGHCPGNDALYARDGLPDYLDGGAGFDAAQRDALDGLFAVEQIV